MLEKVLADPKLQPYRRTFQPGQILFLEGDPSQDLYILVSGTLEVLKGQKVISRISERGAVFGEMSSLLGQRRTATVKALEAVEAICIPKEEFPRFLSEHPEVAQAISQVLARRLESTSQELYGLKEFCDRLPDAVFMTDAQGRLTSMNSAACQLFGLSWDAWRDKPAEELFAEPEEFRRYAEAARQGQPLREQVLRVSHPEGKERFVSVSMSILYDARHHFQGLFCLGRDVTQAQRMRRRLRRVLWWAVPLALVALVLAGALLYGLPYFLRGYQQQTLQQNELRNLLAKDFLVLKALLTEKLAPADRRLTHPVLKKFLAVQESAPLPYRGILLLDPQGRVFDAVVVRGKLELEAMVGSPYGRQEFVEDRPGIYRVFTVYRRDKYHPTSYRSIEAAFAVRHQGRLLGWVVFMLDPAKLRDVYHLTEQDLRRFRFQEPGKP
jgi:PAS domain S-box-containing protein